MGDFLSGPIRAGRAAAVLAVLGLQAGGCASLPPLEDRTASTALMATGDTRIGRGVEAAAAGNPGKTGVYPLGDPLDAFAARTLLARAADRSLDVQYYIWHGDTTGYLLMEELWNAAGRGVRVRLLLDDNGTAGLDDKIAALDSHPSIEVRLFNPFVNRSFRPLGYLTDFSRLNRRMHNKSFTADSQATVVGGRNIGDEYFGAGEGVIFSDLDLLAAGAVVADVARSFDDYWASASAYPAEAIVGKAGPQAVPALLARFTEVRSSPAAVRYVSAVGAAQMVQELLDRKLALEWVPAKLVADEPVKTTGKAKPSDLLYTRLSQAIGTPRSQLDIVSPYFVPGKKGTAALAAIPAQDVDLRILTNSLAATDVGAVHAGYAKRRRDLLRAGVRLYELKPGGAEAQDGVTGATGSSVFRGSSAASLHAKSMASDRERVFVGSFNLDLRSVSLNTEMGLVVESPRLAGQLADWLDDRMPLMAYEVRLAGDGHSLEWVERTGTAEVIHRSEPETGFFKRLGIGFLSLLPIDWLL